MTSPSFRREVQRIQRSLSYGRRPVLPVVEHFKKKLKKSVDTDFKVGGRTPFPWRANKRNTIASKGHSRQLIGTGRMKKGITYTIIALPVKKGAKLQHYEIHVKAPFPGELHQQGRKGPWTIVPKKPGGWLRFVVAEKAGKFYARRRKAYAKRRAGKRVHIPALPGKVVVFAKKVTHPGYPRRKFVVIREGLIREAWRKPLEAYLFHGRMPR